MRKDITLLLFILIVVSWSLYINLTLLEEMADLQELVSIEKEEVRIKVPARNIIGTPPQKVIFESEKPETSEVIQEEPEQSEDIQEKPLTEKEQIDSFIVDIANMYDIEPELIQSIVWHESRYKPDAYNGNCLGLMQVSTRWHADRAEKLGVTDFYDPYGNILLGVDYISELMDRYDDPALALMMYNMKHSTAMSLYEKGEISFYAKSVLERAELLKEEVN